jgi:hypothetical protein
MELFAGIMFQIPFEALFQIWSTRAGNRQRGAETAIKKQKIRQKAFDEGRFAARASKLLWS